MGRPKKELPDNFMDVCEKFHAGKLTIKEAAKECNMPKTTFYEKARGIIKENDGEAG